MLRAGSAVALGGLVLTAVDATTELVGTVVDGTGSTLSAWPSVDALGTEAWPEVFHSGTTSGKTNARQITILNDYTGRTEVPVTGGFAYRYQPAISVRGLCWNGKWNAF